MLFTSYLSIYLSICLSFYLSIYSSLIYFSGLDAVQQTEGSQEEELRRLHQSLDTERILKKEAVNKLTQVMFQRQPQKG